MNFNDCGFRNRGRGRGRSTRGRVNSVTVQKPLMPPPKTPAPRKRTSSSTTGTHSSLNVAWKNESSRSNVSTLVPTSTSFSTSDAESRIVIALSEGRGEAKHEVGIAAIDVSRPSLILCQISDSQSYINTLTKINILNPDEILIPMTFVRADKSNRLTEKIKEYFKHVLITAVPRSAFDKTSGMQYVRELCAPQWNSVIFLLQHRYYALAAASALFTYAEKVLYLLYARESLKIEYQESEGFAFIDIATADGLELVASTSPDAEKKFTSLLGVLNHCLTRIGSRMLRSSILQPSCSVPDIEARLDSVMELKRNPDLMVSVQSILSQLTNVDQLLSVTTILPSQEINFSERQMNYVLKLNVLLEIITPLNLTLKNHRLPFLVDLMEILQCPTFTTIRNTVRDMIHSDAHPAKGQLGNFQRCFAIKSDVNGLLDLVRKAYSERIEEMREYVHGLGTKYNLPLSVSHNNKKGFHIILHLNQRQKYSFKKSDLPDEFIQVDRLATCVTMKTMELINWSTKIDMIQVEILKISNVMIYDLLLEIRQNIGLFYTLCEGIGKLDMLQSLAQASSTDHYVRPVFSEFLEVTNSRHPLLDFLCSTEPTPNTIFASDMHNVHVITGPNGSGKSIFIRQVLLLQVMAQVGSFVPAESASFRVCDRILARISFDDNIEFGVSTFALEIKEVEYFQTMMTKNTLIIIDELGRSTSVEEGTALAMAICEDFSQTNAFVFFTTHFNAITRLENLHLNITNWQLEAYEETTSCGRKKLAYSYNLIPGVTSLKNYGLYCARASWPEEIVSYAEELLKNVWQFKPSIAVFEVGPDQRLKYDLEAALKIAKFKKELTPVKLHECLLLYIEKMNELGWNLNIEEFAGGFPSSSNDSDIPPQYLNQDTSNETNRNKDNIFLTPLNNYDGNKAISQRSDIASRFNESLQNSMYLVPEVTYSQSLCGEASGEIHEVFRFGTPREDYKDSNVATLNTSRNYNEFYNSQSPSAHANYLGFNEFENSKQHCSSEYFKNAVESQCSVTSSRRDNFLAKFRQAHDWTNLNDDQITTSQNNFSLPLHESNERTSTPVQVESKFPSSCIQEGNSDSIPWKTEEEFEDSQSWQTASEGLSNQHESLSRNKSVDLDVSTALDELKSCSEYFSQDWEELRDQNNLAPTENKIQIHSMYVFDANNQLIQAVNPSKEIQSKTDQVVHNPKGKQKETEQGHQNLEDFKREYDDEVRLQQNPMQQILNESRECDGASFHRDLTNEKTEECTDRRTEMLRVSTQGTENTQSYVVSGYLVRDQSSTYRKHLCRHSSHETCHSKCDQTKEKNVKGSGSSLKTSNCVLEEALQSRHLLGSYPKEQSIHVSVTVDYAEDKTNETGLVSLQERGSQLGSYIKRQSSHNSLKTNNSKYMDYQNETSEENAKTICPFRTPNLGTLQEQGSQSRHLTGVRYLERPSSHSAHELSRVDYQGETNEKNAYTEILNLEEQRQLSARKTKSQSSHNLDEFLSMKTGSSKRVDRRSQINEENVTRSCTPNIKALDSSKCVDRRSQINEENVTRSCTPNIKALDSSKCVDRASQTTEKNVNLSGLFNSPNLGILQEVSRPSGISINRHSSYGRYRDSLSKSINYESNANKETAKVNDAQNFKTSIEVSQSRHLSGNCSNEQGASLKTSNSNCIDLEGQTDNGSAKASRFLNSIPHQSEFNSPKPSTKPLEVSINSNEDVIETSQKNEATQFASALSGSWFKRKRFDEEVLPRKTPSFKNFNIEEFPERIVKEQENVFASTSGINSSVEVKRARLSLTNPNEVVLDKKYEEIETFEDIGSCKPKSNANIFEEPIDDVSFNLSLDLFSDVTVTACTSVASSADEFQKRAKFKTPLKKRKFVPPKILSKKEIQSDYIRQDLEMLNVKDETTLMKYHQQILNRPSVQQLQRQRHLAVLRNTGEGFEVIPAAPLTKKRRRKGFPLQKRESATNFDITLFSDKNSGKFERFLEKKKSSSGCTKFRLQIEPTTTATKSFDNLFSRQNSDESNGEEAQGNPENSISNIINKYLRDS